VHRAVANTLCVELDVWVMCQLRVLCAPCRKWANQSSPSVVTLHRAAWGGGRCPRKKIRTFCWQGGGVPVESLDQVIVALIF